MQIFISGKVILFLTFRIIELDILQHNKKSPELKYQFTLHIFTAIGTNQNISRYSLYS